MGTVIESSWENEKLKETIAAQAAVIELLLCGFNESHSNQGFVQSDLVAKIRAIPTDSKHILQDWLDSVMGEPVAWTNPAGTYACPSNESTVYGSHTIPLFKHPEIK